MAQFTANNHGPARYVRDWNELVSTSQDVSLSGDLVKRETDELLEAIVAGDLAQIVKESCDVIWCALDGLVARGVDFNAAFTAVFRSNMTKIGPDGEITRGPDGGIQKGPWYQPPDPAVLVGGRVAA